MNGHMAEMARNWWSVGEVCNEVERDELFRQGGFVSVYEWAAVRHGASRRTVEKAMAVAMNFNAEMAARHGTEKLAATVDYLEATSRSEKPGEATALTFRVPGRGGKYESKSFEDATAADIERSRKLLLESRKGATPEPDPEAVKRLEAIAAAIPAAPKGVVHGQRAEVERASDGKDRYTFRGIAEDELVSFARALLANAEEPGT
jgi:hypothetical protein